MHLNLHLILALRNIQHHEDVATLHVEGIKSFHKEIGHEKYPNTDKRTNDGQESEDLRMTSHKQENDNIDKIGEDEGNKRKFLEPKIQVT